MRRGSGQIRDQGGNVAEGSKPFDFLVGNLDAENEFDFHYRLSDLKRIRGDVLEKGRMSNLIRMNSQCLNANADQPRTDFVRMHNRPRIERER